MNDALARIPDLLAQHLLLAAAAILVGLVISLPLAVLSARNRTLSSVVLGFASLVQTIPSLALLALFYPVLLALSRLVGGGIPALGFLPALLALSLYALLPMLRNGATGLANLDPAVLEAADGVGMTPLQRLWYVEGPLVAPVLMAGIRTASVWTIGAATLSTTVGQPSLGDLIFAGLQTQNWALVLAGCAAAAALALVVDALLGLTERGIRRRRWALVWGSLAALLLGVGVACVPILPLGPPKVVIGVENFSEQFILARVIGHRLEKAGYRVTYREGLGSTVAFTALASNDIDVAVNYSGTVWMGQMHRTDIPAKPLILRGVGVWAVRAHGVRLLGPLGFENAYAFAMREADARRRGISSIADLVPQAPQLDFASDIEFLERPEWKSVQAAYGPIRFRSAHPYQPTFMYRALESGAADVIPAFSSDGRIAADKLRILADPKGAIPGYDAMLLVAPAHAHDARFVAALQPLVGAIPVEAMCEANYMVDRDTNKVSPDAAAQWLEARIGR